ncbi:ABC transporter substrate-binding protein [Nocardia altamirensis]|uniref:ABC transporter substrate-binding protein n=1 Tax=Nocardia altamirensis TaxID=472158 RepID=UPI0008400059|nr:ABC transporter substrate-binding protein [Nocardia altamirensis]
MALFRIGICAATTAFVVGLTACAAPGQTSGTPEQFVVIDTEELGDFSPLLGHGKNGESKIFESLYRVAEGVDDRIPAALPVLAAGPPEPIDGDLSRWRVTTRSGVRFSDGSPFGPEDVVATYNSLIDPAFAAPIAADYDFLRGAKQTGPDTVEFQLTGAYADFDHRLFMAIAPAESFAQPGPADRAELNRNPIGTGPYVLTESRPDQVVLTARTDYWGEQAPVRRFVIRRSDDDNARASQLRDGADGTVLPPELAQAAAKDGYRVVSAVANDWRAITLPSGNPVAGDPAIRRALNVAVDRKAMVEHILGGHGTAMSTLVGPVYGETYDPAQDFTHDQGEAARELDAAGWRVGADGIRAKDGRRAAFEIAYYPTEVLRRDLTMAVVSDAKKVGIEITPVAVDKAKMTPAYLAQTAFMLGGGGQPYTVDGQLYTKLHSRYATPGVGSKWDNASDYVNPKIDQLLDAARAELNTQRRTELYRQVQAEYHRDPAMLALVATNHVYVVRDNGWRITPTALEPHSHGVAWGPWYGLSRWTR